MTGLPSSIMKKYGVTKKAWSVFRSSRKSKKSVSHSKTKVKYMTKRKTGIKGIMGGVVGQAVGVAAYIAFETYVEPRILSAANITNPQIVNIAELALGVYLSRKSGIVGSIGKAAVIINAYQLIYPLMNKTATVQDTGY